MRLFYAIELDDNIKDSLIARQAMLKQNAGSGNFTYRENLHLTLRFMGEIEAADFSVLTKVQDAVATKNEPFSIELSEPNTFSRGNKYIVWWGIRRNASLFKLQKDLEGEIKAKGFPEELKPYNPHITLAREFTTNENIKDILREMGTLSGIIKAENISLMESMRKDGRLVYICRNRTTLGQR